MSVDYQNLRENVKVQMNQMEELINMSRQLLKKIEIYWTKSKTLIN